MAVRTQSLDRLLILGVLLAARAIPSAAQLVVDMPAAHSNCTFEEFIKYVDGAARINSACCTGGAPIQTQA